jgi:hypothetical protein
MSLLETNVQVREKLDKHRCPTCKQVIKTRPCEAYTTLGENAYPCKSYAVQGGKFCASHKKMLGGF